MENSKLILEKLAEREQEIKEASAGIQQEKNQVYQDLAIGCIKGVFKVRDDLKKGLKSFEAVNNRLAELELLYPGYLSFLENAPSWDSGIEPAQIKYLVQYLLSSKWNKDADFWRVMSQIADTIDIPGNPFEEVR